MPAFAFSLVCILVVGVGVGVGAGYDGGVCERVGACCGVGVDVGGQVIVGCGVGEW